MAKKVQIFNNFLDQEVFLEIKKFIMSPRCQWRYVSYIAHKDGRDNDNDGYFVHSFKDCHPQTFEDRYPESPHFPLIAKILDKIQYQNILRIRSSLYPRRDVQKPDPFHVAYNFPHRVCIFYVNTNNGYTMFENGEKIPSVENQLVTFDGRPYSCILYWVDCSGYLCWSVSSK